MHCDRRGFAEHGERSIPGSVQKHAPRCTAAAPRHGAEITATTLAQPPHSTSLSAFAASTEHLLVHHALYGQVSAEHT